MGKPLVGNDEADGDNAQDTQPAPNPQVTRPVTVEVLDENLGPVLGSAPEMPEVQTHALDAARESATASEPAAPSTDSNRDAPRKGSTDVEGRPFNPALHEVTPDGTPRLNREGYIARKRGGGKKRTLDGTQAKPANRSRLVSDTPEAGTQPAVEAQPADDSVYIATGATAAVLLTSVAQMVGGEDFKPESGETDALSNAFAGYFRSKGISDIPPGAALAIVCASYVGKRWNRPTFKEKRQGWLALGIRWWSDFRLRRQLQKQINNVSA